MASRFIAQPDDNKRVGDILEENLGDSKWAAFDAAVAFVKKSGLVHVSDAIAAFCNRAHVRILVGVDLGGTSLEGLTKLREAIADKGEIWICHNAIGSTFHPKVYVFRNDVEALVIVGSTNLTQGGLYTNAEASVVLELDLSVAHDASILQDVDAALARWSHPDSGTSLQLNDDLLGELTRRGYLPPEHYSAETEEAEHLPADAPDETGLFAAVAVPRPPKRTRDSSAFGGSSTPTIFMMTLQKTDVGSGQVTAGASRRSPEVFIPLSARDAQPDFWKWPDGFIEDSNRPGKFDRTGVRMLIGTRIETVNMMTWPVKHDFRLRSEALRSSGRIGDILKIERVLGEDEYEYRVIIIPMASREYLAARELCVNVVKNSEKKFCYI